MKRKIIILCSLLLPVFLYSLPAQNWKSEEIRAKTLYKQGKMEESLEIWKNILSHSNDETIKRESYYWAALIYLNTGNYESAKSNLEYYMTNYKNNGKNYEDAVYQNALLFYLENEHKTAIKMLSFYLESYPHGKMVPHAYYWIGESLFSLTLYDDAFPYFQTVVEHYPNSLKYEAAQYRLKLLEYKQHELVLQNILKWSQEQYLASLDKLRQREIVLQQTLEEFQKTEKKDLLENCLQENRQLKEKIRELEKLLASSSSFEERVTNTEQNDEIKQLKNQELLLNRKLETYLQENKQLKEKIRELEELLTSSSSFEERVTDTEQNDKIKQLKNRELLLDRKEAALKILEEQLKIKGFK